MKKLCLIAAATMIVVAPAFAADESTLTIGMTLSQTGSLNVDSVAQQRGADMWRDELNAAGGIKAGNQRYKVRFVTYDDQSQGGRVQQLYTRLILQDKAQFLFSPYSSGLAATAAVISEQYGKLMLVMGGAEPKIFELSNKYLFQGISSADHYLSGAVEALRSRNPHARVALVYSDDPFSKAVALATRDQARDVAHVVEEVVIGDVARPEQTDAGFVEPALHKLPHHGRGLARRNEDENPIRGSIAHALQERCEIRIEQRHPQCQGDLAAGTGKSLFEIRL